MGGPSWCRARSDWLAGVSPVIRRAGLHCLCKQLRCKSFRTSHRWPRLLQVILAPLYPVTSMFSSWITSVICFMDHLCYISVRNNQGMHFHGPLVRPFLGAPIQHLLLTTNAHTFMDHLQMHFDGPLMHTLQWIT